MDLAHVFANVEAGDVRSAGRCRQVSGQDADGCGLIMTIHIVKVRHLLHDDLLLGVI